MADRIFITTVRHNLKTPDGLLMEYPLGEKTLIAGDTETGKTALVNAIELALTGACTDVMWRDPAKSSHLLALSAGDAGLYCELDLSTGDRCTFALATAGGKPLKKEHEVPDWLKGQGPLTLPVRAIMEALRGSPDTAIARFLSWGRATVSEATMRASMTEETYRLFSEIRAERPEDPDDIVGVIQNVKKTAGEKKRAAKADSTYCERVLRDVGPVVAVTIEDIDAAEAAANLASRERDPLRINGLIAHEIRIANHEYTKAQEYALSTQADFDAHCGQSPTSATLEATKRSSVYSMVCIARNEIITEAERDNADPITCPLCGESVFRCDLVDWKAEHEAVSEESIESAEGAMLAQDAWLQQKERLHEVYMSAYANADAWGNEVKRLMAKFSMTFPDRPYPPPYVTTPFDTDEQANDLRDWIEKEREQAGDSTAPPSLSDSLSRLATLKAQREAFLKTSETRQKREEAIAAYGRWDMLEDACGALQRDAIESGLAAFAERVSKRLLLGERLLFVRNLGGDETFTPAVIRHEDGVVRVALSGSQGARVLDAMASTIADDAGLDLAVVLHEDRAVSPKTLAAEMRALSSAKTQCIRPSVVMPYGKFPAGWTLLDLTPEAAPQE